MIVPRAELPAGAWDGYVELHPEGSFWHTGGWIDYCLAYHPGAIDHSLAIVHEGIILAILPLVQEGEGFTMGGHPGAPPIWSGWVLPQSVWGLVQLSAVQAKVRRVAFRYQPGLQPREVPDGYRVHSWSSYVVDLRRDEKTLWRAVRKSYHSLVRKVERDMHLAVTQHPWGPMNGHAIHRQVAGRETRAQRTWDLMAEWAEAGNALTALVGHRDQIMDPARENGWTGFAYVIRYKNWAYYASGATTEPSTGHALQWQLIRTLRYGGLASYELGWAARPGDSEKERGIAQFKAGWGGELMPVVAVERTF